MSPLYREDTWGHNEALVALCDICAKSGDFINAAEYAELYLKMPELSDKEATEGRTRLATYSGRQGQAAKIDNGHDWYQVYDNASMS